MQCSIIKPGYECTFAVPHACGFGAPQETCYPIADKCEGCGHVQEWPTGKYCAIFAKPSTKWLLGNCNMSTHIKIEQAVEKKVNPLKASKRAAR
jgi:hypothetical protein